MNHLTMQQLEDLGFGIVKSYVHDDFMTQIRRKGKLIIETTWKKNGEFVSQEVTFVEGYINVNAEQVLKLDEILN